MDEKLAAARARKEKWEQVVRDTPTANMLKKLASKAGGSGSVTENAESSGGMQVDLVDELEADEPGESGANEPVAASDDSGFAGTSA